MTNWGTATLNNWDLQTRDYINAQTYQKSTYEIPVSSSSFLASIFLFLPRWPFLGVGVPFSSVISPVQLSVWRSMVFCGGAHITVTTQRHTGKYWCMCVIKARAQSYPAGEGLATLAADKGSGHKVGIMVALEVHVQKLLLPEGFLTLAAGKRLLPCVCALVHYHVPFLICQKNKRSKTNKTVI